MKPNNFLKLVLVLFMLALIHRTSTAETALSRYEIKNLLRHHIATIQEIAQNPHIIKEINQRNSEKISLEKIKQLDALWPTVTIDHPLKQSMFISPAGRYLKSRVEFENSIFSEIFLTDNQGANITAWPITSDYWQGDEAKWQRSFNEGRGDIYIGNLEYDESTQTDAIQISVPVIQNRRAIGVIIAGIKLSHLQAKYLRYRQQNINPPNN